jgi:hypothetical protein
MVLEYEIEAVDSEISAFTIKRQPVPDHLTDRKQALEIKMSMLIAQVQGGILTMEMYLSKVKAAINMEKKRALDFKKKGNLEYARRALMRVKKMEEEVREVEQAEE